ncbi:MAG: FIVAR domain-containing protein, partial [Clostridia bacterium]|nr:FIVAR domain-containing protein [Clostridia bacterium]
MKKIKRIFSILLALTLVLGSVAVAVNAETTPLTEFSGSILTYTIEAEGAENGVLNVEPGDTFTVKIYIETNYYVGPGGLELILWENANLTLSDITAGSFANDWFNPTINNPASTNLFPSAYKTGHTGVYVQREKDGYQTEPKALTTPELLYTLTFKASDTEGTAKIFMPEESIYKTGNTRFGKIRQSISDSSTAYTASYTSLFAETVNVPTLTVNIASAEAPEVPCDYTKLEEALNLEPAYGEDYYDAEAWAAYQDALAAADAIDRDMIVDAAGENQAKIDAAAEALTDAYNALGDPKFVDRTALEEALALTPEYGEENYDADTWAAWEEAVTAGNDTYDGVDGEPDTENYREEVANAAAAINEAFAALKLKAADYSAVDAAKDAAAAIDADKYTAASVEAVNDAVAAVVEGYDITKQAEVDAMAKAINDAIDALVELGNCDYTALDAAIAAYEATVADSYKYSNWDGYEAAYNAAKAVA